MTFVRWCLLLFVISLATSFNTSPPKRKIQFSGYEWYVRSSDKETGPGPNHFSDDTTNVWVDAQGRLHLRMTHRDGKWLCPEVITVKRFGFGQHLFTVEAKLEGLDKNVVFGMFTYDHRDEFSNSEVDIEFSKWGEEQDNNAQFIFFPSVQSVIYSPDKKHRFQFACGDSISEHIIGWSSSSVKFTSRIKDGHTRIDHKARLHVKKQPEAQARMNLWLYKGVPPHNGREAEVIIKSFEFVPF